MPNVAVLGAGMIGSVIAADLATEPDWHVTVHDASADALARAADRARPRLRTEETDLSSPSQVRKVAASSDCVVGALPSSLGYAALQAVIEAKRNYCDISFMPEDALEFDDLAKRHGVTAVVDCGVAPGMSNLLTSQAASSLDHVDSVSIYVGGVPEDRRKPFEYKAAFSPRDVIEEYTRPARLVESGRIVTREALSEIEAIDVPGLGTLEAFNTDGLRSLLRTIEADSMKEKTMRYPGHAEFMRTLRTIGLFDTEELAVGSSRVRPIDVTAKLLFPHWRYAPGERDLTVMRIEVTGTQKGRKRSFRWELLDRYDDAAGTTSMARTTAFPCATMTRLLVRGAIEPKGVLPPELLGGDSNVVEFMLRDQAMRGVHYHAIERAESA